VAVVVLNAQQVARNDRAVRSLAATTWPVQLHPWRDDGCVWTKVRLCFKDHEPVEPAARRAAAALGVQMAKATTDPGYDGAPVAQVSGMFRGVPITVTAYPQQEYPAASDAAPTAVTWIVVALSPSSILRPAEPG
jgi:hypothetical protein